MVVDVLGESSSRGEVDGEEFVVDILGIFCCFDFV